MENNLFNFEKVKTGHRFFEKIEDEFIMTEDDGKSDDNIIFLEGSGKILLSAPHSTKGYLGDTKRDNYTGAITILLHQKTNLPAILFKKEFDSRDFENYKKTIKDICLIKNIPFLKKINFFIDIHGCWNYFAVDIGTIYGKSLVGRFDLNRHLVNSLREQGFETRGYSRNLLISHNSFNAGDPSEKADDNSTILTEWVSKTLDIPSLQLEISRNLRGENPNLTKKFLIGMINYLNFIKTIV